MNLGAVCLDVFFELAGYAILVAAAITIFVRLVKRIHILWLVVLFFGLSYLLVDLVNDRFHQQIFSERHRSQNDLVPQQSCLSYRPSFLQLYASYQMSREEFVRWAESHEWPLSRQQDAIHESLGVIYENDTNELAFSDPELTYTTEMLENGNQLRLYFKDGVMYLSYNSM